MQHSSLMGPQYGAEMHGSCNAAPLMPNMYDYAGLEDPDEFFSSSTLDPTIPEPSSSLIAGVKYDPTVPLGNSIRQEDIAFSLDAVVAELSHQQVTY
jgi:hypothetical protein